MIPGNSKAHQDLLHVRLKIPVDVLLALGALCDEVPDLRRDRNLILAVIEAMRGAMAVGPDEMHRFADLIFRYAKQKNTDFLAQN